MDLLEKLNPQQRAAVTAGLGPVLVLAGPGSGKTRVLTHRIAYLIREMFVPPYNIVAVTFTNKAAAEMRERVEGLLGGRLDGLQIGTFHAICARLLRIEADRTPYSNNFTIYDTDDQIGIVRSILKDLNMDEKKFRPGGVLNAISTAKNELILPEQYPSADYYGEVVRRVYPLYQKRLVESDALDFDDLLMQTVILLRDDDGVREKYQKRFEHVLVDEFQDTNQAQYQLVELFGKPQHNVFVVGDEDQGIYAFRGADYRNVMQFRRDYPNAQVVLLEQNYRSTQPVLDAARAVIDRNPQRTPKALFTDREGGALITVHEAYNEREEGDFVIHTITNLIKREGYEYRDFAVMYRTNAQSGALEETFINYGLPYRVVGGVGFYKRREIRDLVAYLRVINNPNDSASLSRIINVPGRGIGDKSVQTFFGWAQINNWTPSQALDALADGVESPIKGRASKSIEEFAKLLRRWRQVLEQNDIVALFDVLLEDIGYSLHVFQISDTPQQAQERMENVSALRGLMDGKRDLSLNDFLQDTALIADIEVGESLEPDKNAVTLLTLHSAKGLEFPVVFLVGLEDGLLPHTRSFSEPDSMAEERRLMYVGITRAKDRLFVSYAFRRSLYGESSPGIPSRFLGDIPAHLTEGASTRVQALNDRAAYKAATTWDSAPASATGSGKVIPFPGASVGTRAQRPQAETRYKRGQRVMSSKFGEGVVIDSRPDGSDEEVQVRFESYGVKTLSANFANLVILG